MATVLRLIDALVPKLSIYSVSVARDKTFKISGVLGGVLSHGRKTKVLHR